ncbi:diguanylate cyclase [Butyrivibrio sp. INlla16]|uniref:GGDEF domain-containing response regulator n=1 Tax=Butyrivibrio sp. INlla16 TaxID=1520807 RepID=UPI00087EFAC4|nr:diguanylate cyclase [Butyrivibrio sp. INlla16]SDB07788.1 diguanylate cyclase (GGDEF) domain-containing protein [Butyrivibrio sp. INlla16]
MKKILIVDDERITLRMTQHILASQYDTICVTSGSEAIEAYKRERPDMILTDLHMPGMSGFELQNTLQDQYAEHIPVMFMTADADEETEGKGFEQGAVDFIRKPFRADVLLKRVENILNHVEQIQGLKAAAETDPMTGLLNKASSQTEIGAMCRNTRGVLMMIDLDSFKLVNDLYGHSMGDKILIRFAEIIRAAIRNNDIAGRMGGDEFIAFCQNILDEKIVAEKTRFINEELLKSAKEFMGENMNIPLGASVGAVLAPEEGTDFLTLYKKADKALYTVKQNGKHGHSMFVGSGKNEEETTSVTSDIAQDMMILGERNKGKGAYSLDGDQFKLIYRFLCRVQENYQVGNHFIVFTISPEKEGETKIPQEIGDAFYEVVKDSLRGSDVVSQNGKSHVRLLLLESKDVNTDMVIRRIIENWKAKDPEGKYVITYEMEMVKG